MPVDELRERVASLMPRAREDLAQLVSFQSVADARQFPQEECAKAARYVRDAFAAAGLSEVALYDTPDGSQAVYGHAPGPPGTPTVLLYCHYDVQPPLDESAWQTPPFELVERDGRWYGRGAADCKGNIVMHLTALRALGAAGGALPVGVKLIAEGSEEQGGGGLEQFVPEHPDLLRADAIVVADSGNAALGVPTVTTMLRGMVSVVVTVETMASPLHSGMFGGAAPDALAALVHMLATLRDERGNTTVRGLDNTQRWAGAEYPTEQFRADANLRDGVEVLGDGTVADMIWARPSVTVLGIDCPPVLGSTPAIQARAIARVSLRVPPAMDARHAADALVQHLESVAPWQVAVSIEREGYGQPFAARTDGPAYGTLGQAIKAAYGRGLVTRGQGGSIPLCNVFADTYPEAEIMLIGVEEPLSLIHAPNESVDPGEIERLAVAEALFLEEYATTQPAG